MEYVLCVGRGWVVWGVCEVSGVRGWGALLYVVCAVCKMWYVLYT